MLIPSKYAKATNEHINQLINNNKKQILVTAKSSYTKYLSSTLRIKYTHNIFLKFNLILFLFIYLILNIILASANFLASI